MAAFQPRAHFHSPNSTSWRTAPAGAISVTPDSDLPARRSGSLISDGQSADDAKKVYQWYEARLSRSEFKSTYDVRRRTAGQFQSRTENNKRSVVIHNSPGMSNNSFVVD